MSRKIDAKGQNCPIPVVLAKQAIAEGEHTFTIEVDHPAAVENLKRLAASQAFYLSVQEEDGCFILHFTKNREDGDPSQPDNEVETAPPAAPGKDYVIFIGRDVIGSGNPELGANLMQMFFYTLSNSAPLPRCVLFMNAGVKLPALNLQIIEHLGALSAKGVEILVCGTCLNFYGLTDPLPVGLVSNMYDILSRMQSAAKVITL